MPKNKRELPVTPYHQLNFLSIIQFLEPLASASRLGHPRPAPRVGIIAALNGCIVRSSREDLIDCSWTARGCGRSGDL